MMDNRYSIDSFLDRIIKQDNISDLIQDYDEMLNYNLNLSVPHLKKVQMFINEFHIPMQLAPNRAKEHFNISVYYVNLFKKILVNLFTHSKKLNFMTIKGDRLNG